MSTIEATSRAGDALTPGELLEMLYYMRLQRAIEDRAIKLYYQGRIPGAYFTGWGHEAIAVGATYALGPADLLAPMHRDLAAYLMRGIPARRVFAQFLDREGGLTRGRDGNIHMGDPRLGILPFISHMAASVPVAAGMALACRQRGQARVVLTFFGDGATSTGAWHEGVNFAAVQKLPVVYLCNNNQYAYSTPLSKQMAVPNVADRAAGYGIPAEIVDGNDVIAVHEATRRAVAHARAGRGPYLIECKTFRMTGHSAHDAAEYVPRALFEEWSKRDPILMLQKHMVERNWATEVDFKQLHARILREVEEAAEWALHAPYPDPASLEDGVYG